MQLGRQNALSIILTSKLDIRKTDGETDFFQIKEKIKINLQWLPENVVNIRAGIRFQIFDLYKSYYWAILV